MLSQIPCDHSDCAKRNFVRPRVPLNSNLLINIVFFRTEWRTEDIKPVLADAASKYQFDQDRLYLAGFSMGAREAWRLLKDDPNYWAAAVMCAGEPEDTVGLEALVNMPIHQYALFAVT